MSITAYWISPLGECHPVPTTHINFITDNPDLFGLTTADIQAVYDKQNENTKTPVPAEDVIIASVQEKGWIRTKYGSAGNCWTIRYSVRRKTIKGIIYDWIMRDEIQEDNPHFRLIHTNYQPTFVNNGEIEKFLTVKNYSVEKFLTTNDNIIEPGCLNCTHSVWAVGIGQGFFCRSEDKIAQGGDGVKVSSGGFTRFMIPNRNYVCEFYNK